MMQQWRYSERRDKKRVQEVSRLSMVARSLEAPEGSSE
jgi:hypothetical protein